MESKQILNSHSKANKKIIQDLEKELQKSKLAVVRIYPREGKHLAVIQKTNSFRQRNIRYSEQPETMHLQHYCLIEKISTNSTMQKTLTSLISLLKGEMSQFQTKQKKLQEIEDGEFEKKKKKFQYDIDQILQKKNEEIAKINVLKDKANSCRSQRVVFSNLFKKLQNQIKFYEEQYKEQLISSEAIKVRIEEDNKKNKKKKAKTRLSEHVNSPKLSEYIPCYQPKPDLFSIKPQRQSKLIKSKRMKTSKAHISTFRDLQVEKQELMKKINELQTFISEIQSQTECRSTSEIRQLFSNIEEENQKLYDDIIETNQQIERVFLQERSIQKQMDQFDIIECPVPTKTMKKSTCPKIIVKQVENQWNLDDMKCLTASILSLCSLSLSHEDPWNKEELLKEADSIINEISQKKLKTQLVFERLSSNSTDLGINIILHDMKRFQDCQKIMNKTDFKTEYEKQLNKKKRTIRFKK